MDYTLFVLTYSAKALVHTKVGQISMRVKGHEPSQNERAQIAALVLLQEVRELVAIRTKLYRGRITRRYNKMVNPQPLKPRDLAPKKHESSWIICCQIP